MGQPVYLHEVVVQTENRGVWEGSIQREFTFWPGEEEEAGGGK